MVSQRRLLNLITLLILITLVAVACERPLGGTDEAAEGDQTGEVTDANQGGGTDGTTATTDEGASSSEEAATGDTSTDEPTSEETTDDSAEESDAEAGGGTGDASSEEPSGETDQNEETTADDSTNEEATEQENTDENVEASEETNETNEAENNQDSSGDSIPETHTVVAGENLYRIGLKYGISWVAIANENNLANANVLTVGQVLKLPGGSDPAPDPGPTPTPSPQTETTYIVQAGDNLFRIGLKFGISWVQIAEANGLVNPNLISAGDELKIPVDAPGPAPAFSHVVKQGETLFLISLQYGVAWTAIAEANDLTSPYVIYVGQMLEIPGNQ